MISLSDEQKNRLLQARSAEEVAALLREAGVDVQLTERLWAELTHKREADSEELSPDELEAVSGGASARDYIRRGCAATVEPGSDCWGVDGGCVLVHYEYEHMPNAYCEKCGGPCYVEESYNPLLQKHRRYTVCRNCNSSCEKVYYDGGGLPVGGY